MKIDINFRFDRNIVNNKAKKLTESTNLATYQSAIDLLNDIQKSWSSNSPSSPGNPPAVVTGQLSDSGMIEDLSTGTKSIYRVYFKAKHARFMEYGTPTVAPRPFLYPAAKRNGKKFRQRLKVVMK